MARAATKSKPRAGKPQVKFVHKLVLNQWMLSLFDVKRFEQLAEHLRNEKLEGMDENNVHHFHHALTAQLFNLTKLPTELLLEYDQNIVKHTQRLNERRITRGEDPIVWKYFQYLTLLFTEIYLDRYFSDPAALLKAINEQVATCNADKPEADHIASFREDGEAWSQINKLAYWSATGSGKTLLMHANILQYQFYLDKHGRRRDLNRIILLTPNEGLSQQHLREFEAAGLAAELFQKDGAGLFTGQRIEILDIHKLKDEMGDKTIAIDAFEGNNLVLVDEGHRGASGGEEGAWMRFRNALCEKGFSFEYSATFGQAVKGSRALTDTYAKSILFDYSYRYFYSDGFGKDYQILNLDEGTQANHLDSYLVACLLAFFQQQRLFKEQVFAFRPFNIDKPLWIFVGGSVSESPASRLGELQIGDVRPLVPLLEGRMVGQYDCFQKSWVQGHGRRAVWRNNRSLPVDQCRPQYVTYQRLGHQFRVAICDVTSATNVRTVHATLVPEGWVPVTAVVMVRSVFLLAVAPVVEVFSCGIKKTIQFQRFVSSAPNRRSHQVRRISSLRDRFRASWRRRRCSATPV